MDVCALSVEKADEFFANLKLTEFQEKIAHDVIKEIRARLGFLKNVGLGYLTLNRESGSLSGGEAQRIRLATQIGAGLVGVLYILDEPSIGLHQRDNDRLLVTLEGLARSRQFGARRRARRGHDPPGGLHSRPGPGRGRARRRTRGGGNVGTGAGQPAFADGQISDAANLRIPVPKQRKSSRRQDRGSLEILGASENNLKNVDARIPIGTVHVCHGRERFGQEHAGGRHVAPRVDAAGFTARRKGRARIARFRNFEGLEKVDRD